MTLTRRQFTQAASAAHVRPTATMAAIALVNRCSPNTEECDADAATQGVAMPFFLWPMLFWMVVFTPVFTPFGMPHGWVCRRAE